MNKPTNIGGQAVMEGVMMRNGGTYGLAMRNPDGTIVANSYSWYTLTAWFMQRPFMRGFPMLLETLVNGIKALNRSAAQLAQEEGDEIKGWHLFLTMCAAIGMALFLFVLVPHLFSMGMQWLGLSGGVDGVSFHIWDGLFKFGIFIGYILAISFIPEIKRVFQYHGAEHKVISAYEQGGEVTVEKARKCSRLHPRCGTTFVLFVLSIAIILHTVLVPMLLLIWIPENAFNKHMLILLFKLILMIPISALAYETIKYAARMPEGTLSNFLRAPGMFLQLLTTKEPDDSQLEVAIVALAVAMGSDCPENIQVPAYSELSTN